MTHVSGKQPYGCSQPRMVELRSCLPLRMVELRSCLPLPGYRNPRVHSKTSTNLRMDWAAAEAEDEEDEAEDEQDSGTASGGRQHHAERKLAPIRMVWCQFQPRQLLQVPSRTTWRGLGPKFSRRSPPHRRQRRHQHRN